MPEDDAREAAASPGEGVGVQDAEEPAPGPGGVEAPGPTAGAAEHEGDGTQVRGEEHGPEAPGPGPGAGAQLEEARRERDEYLDALRRLQADFENYKKRMVKQQTQHLERAAESLVSNLLPALDALDLAVVHSESSDDPGSAALVQVAGMLTDLLAKEGLERIYPQGDAFDPTLHEAVMHEAGAAEGGASGPEVTEVLRAGYLWKGRVLRPAMVKVKG